MESLHTYVDELNLLKNQKSIIVVLYCYSTSVVGDDAVEQHVCHTGEYYLTHLVGVLHCYGHPRVVIMVC